MQDTWDTMHKAKKHFQRAENQSNSETNEEPGARAQDKIPAVCCHMTQAESFPTIQKKNLKDKNELAILTSSKGFPQRELQASSPLQGDRHKTCPSTLCPAWPGSTENPGRTEPSQEVVHSPSAYSLFGFMYSRLVLKMLFAFSSSLTQPLHIGPHHMPNKPLDDIHRSNSKLIQKTLLKFRVGSECGFSLEGKAVMHWRVTARQ